MKKFDLNAQFEAYLQRCRIGDLPKESVQYIELKRAFMGSAGQMLILFRDEIGSIENEDEAVAVMENLFTQVTEFWNNERK